MYSWISPGRVEPDERRRRRTRLAIRKIGIDYRRIGDSGSAHVMQNLYDYSRGGRQEDRYPTMSWSCEGASSS